MASFGSEVGFSAPGLDGVSHLDLTVTDLDRSVAFYTGVLGFTVDRRVEKPGLVAAFMTHGGLPFSIGVVCPGAGDGSRFDEHRTGLDHLSFRVASRVELERWEQHLADRGVAYSPIVEIPDGSGVLVFRDPDNIQLEILSEPGT